MSGSPVRRRPRSTATGMSCSSQQPTAVEPSKPPWSSRSPSWRRRLDEPPQTANDQDIRFSSPLPRIENLLEHINAGLLSQQREQASTVNMDVPSPARGTAGSGRAAADGPDAPARSRRSRRPQTVATRHGTVQDRDRDRADHGIPGARSTWWAEGDSLSSIAKKVYGLEEGNRMVNVKRIFQANQGDPQIPA